ncbi:hypothetical protein HOB30_02470 [Candidatus Falkowbacteria bacterium]|jgi:hypothetical protein|nr:hypothetical protein [Candidatus Falkowbacteria bacterium]
MFNKTKDKSDWAIGGGIIAGLGAGFFFLPGNAMAFVGCLLAGLGVGLIIAPIISKMKN